MSATVHTIKIDPMRSFRVEKVGGLVSLSVQNLLINTSTIAIDPQTARALGAALWLTGEATAKAVPA